MLRVSLLQSRIQRCLLKDRAPAPLAKRAASALLLRDETMVSALQFDCTTE